MNALAELERNTFSDPEYVRRRRRGNRKGLSVSTSQLNYDDTSETNSAELKTKEPQDAGENEDRPPGSCPLDSQHQGKKLLHVIVSLPIDYIFSLIFIQEQLMMSVYQGRKVSEVVNGPWQEEKDTNQLSRTVTYSMAINVANFGSRTSYVTEKQTLEHSQKGKCYVVTTEANNNNIPYADSFYIFSHYCLQKEPDSRTKITVWTQVKYKKQVWGVVKGMLERNAYNGLEAFLSELLSQITLVAERSERKGGGDVPVTSKPKTHVRSSSYGHKRQIRSAGKESKEVTKDSTSSGCNLWISISMTLAFAMLILSNYILYGKLHDLEVRSEQKSSLKPQLARFLEGSETPNEKANFVNKHQEVLNEQMQGWKDTLVEASNSLEQVQDALQMMLDKIRYSEDALLKVAQKFKSMNSETYGKSSSGHNNGSGSGETISSS